MTRPPLLLNCGLSPLARGTVLKGRYSVERGRFIPTRAGNRIHGVGYLMQSAVYPRSRGEQLQKARCSSETGGLSPLARGTVIIASCILIGYRFIPARAGNREVLPSYFLPHPVYPRSRGEQSHHLIIDKTNDGLSPLARGTERQYGHNPRPPRFIPARAGNRY